MPFVPTQPVLQLITSCLYPSTTSNIVSSGTVSNGVLNGHTMDIDGDDTLAPKSSPYAHDTAPLISMFRAEFCRRHEWPKEEPLEVVADLGSRGGALNAIEKARRVMGERLGSVRTWTDLPVR